MRRFAPTPLPITSALHVRLPSPPKFALSGVSNSYPEPGLHALGAIEILARDGFGEIGLSTRV